MMLARETPADTASNNSATSQNKERGIPSGDRLETLQQDIKFVNNLLSQNGLEAPFPFARLVAEIPTSGAGAGGSDLYNLESAVSILITLLNSKQRENAFRNEADDRLKRLNDELDSREILLNKFHGKLEASEKELRTTQQQLREATARIQQLEGIAQAATEESNRIKSVFTTKEKHFTNELRKRERDFEKLRDQLQSCLREPAATIASGTRAENAFDVSRMKKSLPKTVSMTNSMVSDDDGDDEFEERRVNQENNCYVSTATSVSKMARIELLEHENANMRQLLSSLNQILAEMRKTAQLQAGLLDEHEEAEEATAVDLNGQINSLPISWIYDKVKDEIEQSLAAISDFLRAVASSS